MGKGCQCVWYSFQDPPVQTLADFNLDGNLDLISATYDGRPTDVISVKAMADSSLSF